MSRRPITSVSEAVLSDDLLRKVASFRYDPLGFVRFAFPWGVAGTELAEKDGPDIWQAEFLTGLGKAVRERDGDVAGALGAYLAGAATGHGTGKSTLVCWVLIWAMSVWVDPQIIVTANTKGQLSSTTWRELAKWHGLAVNSEWFTWTGTRLIHKGRSSTHYAEAIPWSKENAQAFAGKHGRRLLLIFDEASTVDDEIWTVAEGAMTTRGAVWLVFGNPTKNTGRFRECFRQFRARWRMWQVDSRLTKAATNKAQIAQWLDDYGEDSDFFRVRVRGMFPRASTSQFIPQDLVDNGQREFRRRFGSVLHERLKLMGPGSFADYQVDTNPYAPKIFGLDVARKEDDQSVLGMRVGSVFMALEKWRGQNTPQLTARVADWISAERPDVVFIDAVGVGAGVADLLEELGFPIERVHSGMTALDTRRYNNRRTECWGNLKEWLRAGGAVDHLDTELSLDLIAPEYGYAGRLEKEQLETKEDMRSRGLPSTDTADALAYTFYMPVAFREGVGSVVKRLAQAGQASRQSGGSWMSY